MATTETAPSCCAVCLDDLRTELSALPCGHVLHHLCATRALREVQQCPICRKRAKHAVRLFYTAGARSSKRTLASPSSASAVAAATSSLQSASSSHHADSIDQKFAALRKSVLRLAADQRMISSHSFRLETENVRLRQESSRAADQLASAHSKIDTLTKELDVWKRIATRSHTQLQELRVETSAADRELLTSMQTLTRELQTFSACGSCRCASQVSHAAVRALCATVESTSSSRRARKMACCGTDSSSRALRSFCARHTSSTAAATETSLQ